MKNETDYKNSCKAIFGIKEVYTLFEPLSVSGHECKAPAKVGIDHIRFECSIPRYLWFYKDKVQIDLDMKSQSIFFEKEGSFSLKDNIGFMHPFKVSEILDNFKVSVIADTIIFDRNVTIHSDANFTSKNDIRFLEDVKVFKKGSGNLYLKAGIGNDKGQVIFGKDEKAIKVEDGEVIINYHPEAKVGSHKYHNPIQYSKYVEPSGAVTAYMLVNNVQDLQSIRNYLHGDYALSQNIDASSTINWDEGKGFKPLKLDIRTQPTPYSGNFDGNGFNISGLHINRPDENFIGLFGIAKGYKDQKIHIGNFGLVNSSITGGNYVGGVAGYALHADISDTKVENLHVAAKELGGGIFGSGEDLELNNLGFKQITVNAEEKGAYISGAVTDFNITQCACALENTNDISEDPCFAYIYPG